MIIRDGHYRLFRDQQHKVSQMSRWGDPDANIPNKLFKEYIYEVIDPIRQKSSFGFNAIDRDYFERQNKKIRRLSEIGYRLLNFISYCHLFFSYCLGNISHKDLNECLIKNCDILGIIQIDWNLLKEALQQKNIGSIQIFLNLIFKDLCKLIKKYEITKNNIDRENFENQVEELIEKYLKKYPDYVQIYNEENQKQTNSDIKSLKTYVTELIHPSADSYTEKEYPMFKYFIYTKYKSIEDMIKKINKKEKYPLIIQLFCGGSDIQNMAYLQNFNDFTNHMVNHYTFQISREDAKKRSLEDEDIAKEKGFDKLFGNFKIAWKQIKSSATKYGCRPDMVVKEKFEKKDKLINFLTDDGELYNGMYLAAACSNFILLQNSFLQPIVNSNTFTGILHNYVNNIIRKIPVQEAKKEQIVLIDERFKQYGKYVDVNDVIYAFSERNVFGQNGKINYSDYNSFVYDYERIEEELGKILLPGVCLFADDKEINFVTYWGEGFRGGHSSMMSKFYGKYTQNDLDQGEKENVISYIGYMNKNQAMRNNKNYDFKNFFSSLQMLLFYLTEKGIMKEEEKIKDVINHAPGYLKLSDDCKNFFNNEGDNLTINKIMNLYFFFEHLCFEDLAETLQPEYRAKIPEEVKNKIITKLIKQKKEKDQIPIKSLAAAARRLISRSLAGKREETDVKEDNVLSQYLIKRELWEEKIGKLENLDDLIAEKIYEFKLTIGQAYEFYNIIGEEDRNTLNTTNQK